VTITDNFRQKLIVPGGVAVEADVNNAQRFLGARLYDQFVSRLAKAFNSSEVMFNPSPIPTTPYAYALSGGAAYPKQGTTGNNYVMFAAGTVFQKIAADSGTEETFLAFTFDGTTSSEVSFAAGDPTNPRVDLIQMKLELIEGDAASIAFDNGTPPTVNIISSSQNTTRRVRCTLSVKAGTPAASPTPPTLDAGNCALAMVLVGANYSTATAITFEDAAGAVAVLHDLRVPLHAQALHVMPRDFVYTAADITHAAGALMLTVSAVAGSNVTAICPFGGSVGRLLGMDAYWKDVAVSSTRVGKYKHADAGETFTNGNDGNLGGASGTNQRIRRLTSLGSCAHTPAAGPTINISADNIRPPLWTNGKRCPITEQGTAPNPFEAVALRWPTAPQNTEIGPVTFIVAN